MIRISVTSVYVDDQDKALAFYTEVLGFEKRADYPLGPTRWLTIASPTQPDGVELLLEPNTHPVARAYQRGLVEAGIPATTFAVDDIHAEYERMLRLGVAFTMHPTPVGTVTQAVLDDTCGNLIMLAEVG